MSAKPYTTTTTGGAGAADAACGCAIATCYINFPKMIQTNSNDEKGMPCPYIIIHVAVIDAILDIPKKYTFLFQNKANKMA